MRIIVLISLFIFYNDVRAQNPVITTQYTADPTARVFNGKIYLYPSHDILAGEGKGRVGWFCMEDYHVFSSADLSHWTDHGIVVSQKNVPWVKPDSYSMWAPDCVFRNGKYYFYFPSIPGDSTYGKGFAIGVAIADKPEGPYVPQPEPIKRVHGIDPNVFIDRDGQAYLYWAQGNVYAARLGDNMLELASDPVLLKELPAKGLKEGPFLFERNGIYYLTYPHVRDRTESLEYATGDGPLGPFTPKGVIMDESPTGCWTNHQSIVQFNGQWFLFYHHNDLSPGFDKARSVRIDSLFFNADGSIRKVNPTLRGVGLTKATDSIQPDRYSRLSDTGAAIAFLDTANRFEGWKTVLHGANAWVQYNSVDFGDTPLHSVSVRASSVDGGDLQVRIDAVDGPVIARLTVHGGGNGWQMVTAPLEKYQPGVHPLFLLWQNSAPVEIDWLRFSVKAAATAFNRVETYVNPVLPGDHPDPTLLKVGEDFYHCGSSFHFSPYLPIYHSKDLVHWKVIGRVVPPAVAAAFVADRPSAGIWQGAISYFYSSYWIYFSSGGQWFCKANSPAGPWSAPVKVKTNPATGDLGYDNSIFVDDDGKPYMVIKNGQKVNRIQALGKQGQLADTVINLDWINANLQYSWAEGPVMCKRNGWYYYFPAGDVTGGQYVLRTRRLTSDSTYWERLGDFFKPVTDMGEGFRRPNHISAPVQLADGTWWTIGQSYEKYDNDDWSGTGRQTSLYPVTWEGDRPWGMAPTTQPIVKPDLPRSGILWTSVEGDDFSSDKLGLQWHFLTRKAADGYSLSARKGWVRLTPDGGSTHLVQKETDHYYTVVTKVDLDAIDTGAKAGIYLTNGNQQVVGRLYTGYDGGKRIFFRLDTAERSVANPAGRIVWLKLERNGHALTGYYSADGETWIALGASISAADIDKVQPNYNSWVGTSLGLFAEGKPADFDLFTCKDAFSVLPAVGYANYYGVRRVSNAGGSGVTNTSVQGGWFMIPGVETGQVSPSGVEVTVAARKAGKLEVWLDDLEQGTKVATIAVKPTGRGDRYQLISGAVRGISGHHDLFVKFPEGTEGSIFIKSIRFVK
jgi:xylan 1,4-beta-xylosidase